MKKNVQLAAIVIGLLMILYSFVNFSLNQLWDWVSTVSLILGLVLAGVGVYHQRKYSRKQVDRRTLMYGGTSALSTLVFLGIITLLAFLTTRHHARADLTEKGLFSLAPQTKKVLKDLNKEVKIWAFYKQSDATMAQDLLDEYAFRSRYISYQIVDPNQKPQLARRYQITKYNTVVVESGGKRETIEELNESNLTNAIIKVTRELDKVVYFVTGHGEKDIESDKPDGYKFFADGIKKENYIVKTLNLAESKSVPEDCSVLVIAGPQADFFPFELDSIKAYLEKGGKVMVLIDPMWKPGLVDLLKEYNIQVDDDIVVDNSGIGMLFGMGPEVPLVSRYEKHELFKDFNITTFYPVACSVRPLEEDRAKFTTEVLFRTSRNSWGEKDYQHREVTFNAGKDIKGPVSLAVLSTKTLDGGKKAQLLVVGDSDFASNAYIRNSGNYDLALNMVNWMAEEEDLITIRPREFDDRRVNLTQKQSKTVLYVSVFALPLMIILAGVVIYYRRR
ncbi:MAG: hypothetical protein D6715_12425 [Calditrichaeota bacterium]|nr:MAG: hypothetical protein D6715_12425 [Calditrichota bacterium]